MRIRPRITPRKMKMWKNEILRLVLFLLVAGYVECQPWALRPRHPLCVSQFALANGACMHLPIYTVPPPPAPLAPGPPPAPVAPGPDPEPPSPDPDDALSHHHRNRTGHDHDHNHNHDDRNHRRGGHHDHDDHNHGHRRGHHENGGEQDQNGRRHHHRHHHDHERRKVQEEPPAPGSPVEQECCHWLQQVDNDCVCNVLVNLPPFLSRPVHEYTVLVDHVCNVTFACPSRIRL